MDPNRIAAAWLQALDRGERLPSEIAFGQELAQAGLDGTLESLDRIDRLLLRIRSSRAWTAQAWDRQSGGEAFLHFVCFYLGRVLERLCNIEVNWCTREQALELMPADKPLPQERWARLVGVVADSALVPLGLLEHLLFESSPDMSCRQYVEGWAARARNRETDRQQSTDENARCSKLLAAMQGADLEATQGIAYRNEVQALRLDASIDSLKRLDSLLRVIRKRDQPSFGDFVNRRATQDFARWAACYAAMTAARHAKTSIKWLNYRELKELADELDFQFETSAGCILGGRLYLPLDLVTEILFHPQPQRSLRAWAQAVDEQTDSGMRMIPVPRRPERAAADTANLLWDRAVHEAGMLAAWSMAVVSDGGMLAPQLLQPQGDDKNMIRDFSFYENAAEAQQVLDAQLEHNPDQLPFQVLTFDGFANLPTGRTDAVTIDLRCYGTGLLASDTVMSLKIACPYRSAKDPQGFAIDTPFLLESSVPADQQAALFDAFHRGIDAFRMEGFSWDRYAQHERA